MNNYDDFVAQIQKDISAKKKHNKASIQKIAQSFGIQNKNLIKELTELAIVLEARKIVYKGQIDIDTFQDIVELYKNQVNISHRTSQSMLLQQYSTPVPISFIASLHVRSDKRNAYYFEPSAGNGLLTIALPPEYVTVNELDDIRLNNLKTQNFDYITNSDATLPFIKYYKNFDGIITNPPFGTLDEAVIYDGFPIKTLDHLMALRALDCMTDDGKASIIIGGHTTWDKLGRIQAGKNRIFFNYLYSHYNVEDVILIDGHKLYSKQGTSFDVRLILINGRKKQPTGFAPLKNDTLANVVTDFEELWNRVFEIQKEKPEGNEFIVNISERKIENNKSENLSLKLAKDESRDKEKKIHAAKAKAKLKLLKLMGIGNSLQGINDVTIINDTEWINLSVKELKRKAESFFDDFLKQKTVINSNTNFEIILAKRGFDHTIQKNEWSYENIVIFKKLDEVIQNAYFVPPIGYPTETEQKKGTVLFYNFHSKVSINGTMSVVKITIREHQEKGKNATKLKFYYDHYKIK